MFYMLRYTRVNNVVKNEMQQLTKSEFHFLPPTYTFVTPTTPFSENFSRLPHLMELFSDFTPFKHLAHSSRLDLLN